MYRFYVTTFSLVYINQLLVEDPVKLPLLFSILKSWSTVFNFMCEKKITTFSCKIILIFFSTVYKCMKKYEIYLEIFLHSKEKHLL